jgi:predicted restriction endonuclease
VLDMSGMIRVSESELAKLRKFDTESRKQGVANIIETILKRRGDPQFRRTLLEAYDGRCAITNFNALDSLEAAYIVPFRGKHTNEPSNGLLLRSDIHTLFDVGKLAIDTLTMTVILADDMIHTSYRILAGRPLRYPEEPSQRPDTDSLDLHRRLAGL